MTGGLFRFRVWTNAAVLDDNPWFLISRDGRVKHAACMGRPAAVGRESYDSRTPAEE